MMVYGRRMPSKMNKKEVRKMKKIIIAAIALAVFAIGAALVIAQRSEGFRSHGKGNGGMHGGAGMALRGLDLTEEQKAEVKRLSEAHEQTVAPLHAAMKANREMLKAATANGAFDEAAVSAIANEHGSIAAQMLVARERFKSQIFAMLTDEQKAKFAESRKNRREGFRRGPEHRGGKRHNPDTEKSSPEQPAE